MNQLVNKFKDILSYLNEPFMDDHAGDKRICYLTFPIENTLAVKKQMGTFRSMLNHYNYDYHELSLGNLIHKFLLNNKRRDNWKSFEKAEYAFAMTEFYNSLGNTVKTVQVIENEILTTQATLMSKNKPLLILTDLEGIHPFTRFGPIEQSIYNQIEIPMLVFYPGNIIGNSLQFLGFYPQDGNYRSKHF